jgi:alkaline phosphatase D
MFHPCSHLSKIRLSKRGRKTMPKKVNRRTILKGLGAVTGAVAFRGFEASASTPVYFTHGVASGDPAADKIILWSRVVPANPKQQLVTSTWQISETSNFKTLANEGTLQTDATHDYTLKVDATNLKPATHYFYRFTCQGIHSPVGKTRTLPIGEVDSYKIGVVSCSNYPQGYFNAYRHLAQADLDLVIHLGDYIYEYAEGRYANPIALSELGRHVVPVHEIVSLEDYRMRYGLYRTDIDLQKVHRRHPFICVWDDHELANNTWQSGAQNHNKGEGDFNERMQNARQAYCEWMPIRTEPQGPIYRQFSIGQLADIFMLDTRLHGRERGYIYQQDLLSSDKADVEAFRKKLAHPARTILGLDQEAWLTSALQTSKTRGATWQVLGQQVLMGKITTPELNEADFTNVEISERRRRYLDRVSFIAKEKLPFNLDAWDGYPACRDRVMASLKTETNNPIVLAGDTHNAWAFNLTDKALDKIGVEIGTPGITSPGLETFLPAHPNNLKKALMSSSPEIFDMDTQHRGWTELTLTSDAMTSRWHFVDTILSTKYSVLSTEPIICKKGARAFNSK